ncbi:MAG: S-adenosylmethionine:tRNA ribosyltransferase-isomerase, partial [FCB group bacterium]|nr:S-adenosylmethionine:tRNA ribosyltransferase-isomerase [FCB group bacterium]
MSDKCIDTPLTVSHLRYDLPENLIAQYPSGERTASKLLIADRNTGELSEDIFSNLPSLLDSTGLIVLNDTKVFKARLIGTRADTGGKVEVFLLRNIGNSVWRAIIKPGRQAKKGLCFDFGNNLKADVLDILDRKRVLLRLFSNNADLDTILSETAQVPLPPYIRRVPEEIDSDRYQTIYANNSGAVAAPTAGLHFDNKLLQRIKSIGFDIIFLTLHVGPGTFEPLRNEVIKENKLESEEFEISAEAICKLKEAKAAERNIIAVGTTTTRVLESIDLNSVSGNISGETDKFIYPPY